MRARHWIAFAGAGLFAATLAVVLVRGGGEPALVWQACPPGAMRPGHGCGDAVDWEHARASCAPPWRLPREGELRELMGPRGCAADLRCRTLFGDDEGIYWSSTTTASGDVRVAWLGSGDVTSDPPSALNLVRCVRD